MKIRLFDDLIDRLVKGSIEYLSHQINAGAEVKKYLMLGGFLKEKTLTNMHEPCKKIIAALKSKHWHSIIAFQGKLVKNVGLQKTGADCVALDDSVTADWIARNVQGDGCVQGNLASSHMVSGGAGLIMRQKNS